MFEVGWLIWFLTVPLPNASNVNGYQAQRWGFPALALPGVLPGVRLERSYVGMAIEKLSHLENLRQRVPIVLGGVLIVAAAVALGRILLRALKLADALDSGERLVIAFGVGAASLGIATLIAGRLGLLSPPRVRCGLVALVMIDGLFTVLGRIRRHPRDSSEPVPTRSGAKLFSSFGLFLIVAPFVLLMTLGAMLPAFDYDALEYHLQGPKEYFLAGRISFLPHNVYTSMPFGIEMLHLLAMEVFGDWWWGALVGQLVVSSFAVWTAALVGLTARRLVSRRAGWVAVVVYLTTPWVYRMATIPFVEGPLCFYHAAAVWIAARALQSGRTLNRGIDDDGALHGATSRVNRALSTRLWGLVGLLAGSAMACKYPALISAVIPFGLLAVMEAVRRRSLGIVFAYGLSCGVVVAPWLTKNVVDTGNPVYPLAYKVFGGRHWGPSLDEKWWNAHGPLPISVDLLAESVMDVVGRSDWQSSLYFALAPLAILRRGSRRIALALWAYVLYLFLTWWLFTHRIDRFWLPLLPPMAVLAGIGADWIRDRVWSIFLGLILIVSILTNLVYVTTTLAGFNEWTGDLNALRVQVPFLIDAPLARADVESPQEAKVLIVGQATVFHLVHSNLYNTVFNEETIEALAQGRPPEDVRRALVALGVSSIYVDWREIEYHRRPGGYGFTPYVQPEVFARLAEDGVLGPPKSLGPRQELYPVRRD